MRGARRTSAGLAVVAAAVLAPTAGAAQWTLRAPSGPLRVQVRTDARGLATLTARRDGRIVLTAAAGRLPGRVRAHRTGVDQRFSTPAGKRRAHHLRARRLLLRAGGRRLEVLAAPDGLALRLRGAGSPEPTTFRAPAGTRAWLQHYTGGYEEPYAARRLATVRRGRFGFPTLLRAPGRPAVLLTESGLHTGDGAAHLEARRGRRLQVAPPTHTRSADPTPWRVAVIGPLATVVESDLPLALGTASKLRDTSWIRPGRAAWSWWADSASTSDPARLRAYVDLAARLGWEYALVDARFRRDQLPGLVAYARERGVRLLLWFDAQDLATAAQRARVLDDVAGLGFAGIKVDYLLSDRPARIGLYGAIARAAAQRRLVVGFHGATVPRGLQRTWPNVLTVEAVRGAEHARGDEPALSPAQSVDLVFTRNVVGSMDYTPVAFSARHRRTSDAHELAEAVAYESGIQHYADTPESYAAHPLAEDVLRAVPAAWDQTRLVAGTPGRDAALARRAGQTWWLGALSAGAPRTLALPLRFLPAGRTYTATLTQDGPDGLRTTTQTVTRTTVLREPVVRDGGLVVRLDPAA